MTISYGQAFAGRQGPRGVLGCPARACYNFRIEATRFNFALKNEVHDIFVIRRDCDFETMRKWQS